MTLHLKELFITGGRYGISLIKSCLLDKTHSAARFSYEFVFVYVVIIVLIRFTCGKNSRKEQFSNETHFGMVMCW